MRKFPSREFSPCKREENIPALVGHKLKSYSYHKSINEIDLLYFFIGDQTGKMFKRAVVSSFRIIRKTAGRKFTGSKMVA